MPLTKPYGKKSPCNTCPYRVDVKLQTWDIKEFILLLEKEAELMGTTYACHTKDGNMCIGWLMDQDKRNHPSIALRISLIKHNVTREYLDALSCKSPLYASVIEMCKTNYPKQFKHIK